MLFMYFHGAIKIFVDYYHKIVYKILHWLLGNRLMYALSFAICITYINLEMYNYFWSIFVEKFLFLW